MPALDRKLGRDLWRMRTQALAIALVIGAGLATFDMSFSVLETLRASRDAYYEEHRFGDVFARVKRAPLSVLARLAAIPGVAAVEDRVVMDVTLGVEGFRDPVTGRLVSLPRPGAPGLNRVHLRSGRLPEAGRADEVLASEGFATAQGLEPGDGVEALVGGRWRRFRIVGIALSPEYVYSIGPGSIFPDDLRFGVLWASRDALAAAFDMEGAWNDVSASLARGASERAVIDRMDALLARHGGLGAHGRKDQVSHFFLSGELDELRAMGTTAPLVFLSVAAFILHVVISRLVTTQRTQVATLKAFGYSNLAVGSHYLQLVLVMALAGVALGAAGGEWLGDGLVAMYAGYFRFPVLAHRLDSLVVLEGALLAVAVSVAATIAALRRVVRLPPAEAMRPEAPATFRATLVERVGVERLFSAEGRMVLRRLERRPWKAALSCTGIALAVAILVVSRFPVDAVRLILDVQFNAAQRADLTVTFSEPRAASALGDVRHLPGVLRAEPFRAVAARVRAGHRSRRIALDGIPRGSDLQRVIEAERAVALPHDGLVLSSKLAEILGVGAGDLVLLEVLEGERPVRSVEVARVAEQFVGLSATMEIGALRRVLGEGPLISGAQVAADPRRLGELSDALRRTPGVAGVTLQSAAVASLEETLEETMLRMTFFNILFAGIIAFGVVYNVARVALAEQARELASLRILGFTRREVSVVLLGELAVVTFAALPLGLWLGRAVSGLLASLLDTELYRIPLVVSHATDGFAVAVVLGAAALSALVVRRRIDTLDLVGVLKAAE